jgi:ketosteroid isomerase-like protein
MSQENVEIVRRVWEAVRREDTEAVLALYDEDVEYDFSRSPFQSVGVNQPAYRGHDALRSLFRERYEDWAQVEDHCQELIEANDEVISVVTSRGRGRESGIEVEGRHVGLWSLREGKVIRVRWFGTLADALAAVGPSE